MRHQKFLLLLVITLYLFFFIILPVNNVQSSAVNQDQENVIATGNFCEHNICGSITFEFNPEGGLVNGSFTGTRTTDQYGILHVKGNLTGFFAGGDGGLISGSVIDAQWWWTSKATGNVVDSPVDFSNVNMDSWNGYLYASGNGNGTIGESGSWSVTYLSDGFQAIYEEQTPSTSENQTPILTPTNAVVVGQQLTLLPETKTFISSSPTVDEAVKTIFKQDAAIIVRDENNQFYAINNDAKSVALPPGLNTYFRTSNHFAILGNDELLASSEHGSIRGTINGGGDFVLMDKIPPELKEHDYTMVATNCATPTECTPLMKINSTASSTKVFATCLMPQSEATQTGIEQGDVYYISSPGGRIGSSEHGSCRGTINGGGDFIFRPQSEILASLDYPARFTREESTSSGYLGVLVENKTNGAEIQQIQEGSPASTTGLEIGDLISTVSGTAINDQQTLGSVLSQFSGGEEVALGVIHDRQVSTVNLTLATMTAPVIETPTATITLTDKTELVVDIGFNGVTGILILADSAYVIEPVTGTGVEVPAGYAAIVVPGKPLDTIYEMSDSDVNKWWEDQTVTSTNPQSDTGTVQNSEGFKEFNPIQGVNEEDVYWIACVGIAILYFIVLLGLLLKK